MHQVFSKEIHLRFAHCDSVGIVFHPHYFTIFNGVIEDFFREVVKKPFTEILKEGIVYPVVGLQCNFLSPCRAGEVCTARLWIEKLGGASVRFAITLSRGETECVRLVETMVRVSEAKGFKPIALSEVFRKRVEPYVASAETKPLALRS